MMHSVMCTSVQPTRSCIFVSGKPPSDLDGIAHGPRTAITVHSKPNVLPVRRDAASAAVWMSNIWIGSEVTTRPKPTKRPYASAKSGWNRYSARAKDWHGLRRFRLRRLWRVNCEALRIAAGQNLKRLLKKRGWGRRPFPAEAMCAFFFVASWWMTSTSLADVPVSLLLDCGDPVS